MPDTHRPQDLYKGFFVETKPETEIETIREAWVKNKTNWYELGHVFNEQKGRLRANIEEYNKKYPNDEIPYTTACEYRQVYRYTKKSARADFHSIGYTLLRTAVRNATLEQFEELIEWAIEEKATVKELCNYIHEQTRPEPVPLPEGVYNIIYADPPWKYDFSISPTRKVEKQYFTMELTDIETMKIPSADNAVLFLWATAPKLREALKVMEAWGFEYKTNAVWDKEIIGMGYWFRGQHEILLVGTKGEFSPPPPEVRIASVIRQRRGKHSEKPKQFYEIIEQMCPDGKYLELFARNQRDGWTMWGNEVNA